MDKYYKDLQKYSGSNTGKLKEAREKGRLLQRNDGGKWECEEDEESWKVEGRVHLGRDKPYVPDPN